MENVNLYSVEVSYSRKFYFISSLTNNFCNLMALASKLSTFFCAVDFLSYSKCCLPFLFVRSKCFKEKKRNPKTKTKLFHFKRIVYIWNLRSFVFCFHDQNFHAFVFSNWKEKSCSKNHACLNEIGCCLIYPLRNFYDFQIKALHFTTPKQKQIFY